MNDDLVGSFTNLLSTIDNMIDQKRNDAGKNTIGPANRLLLEDAQLIAEPISSCQQQMVNEIAVIIGFYGLDKKRITATFKAIFKLFNCKFLPQDIVFVEAQHKKDDAVFSWTKQYGVKYKFAKAPLASDGLMLKTALWNIGAQMTNAGKLCFIDSDVVFENGSWLKTVDEAFNKYDVLSLAGWCKYENDPNGRGAIESIGHKIMSSNETIFSGHPGLTLGMTRLAYEMYGKFEAFVKHADVWIWQKICGSDNYKDIVGYTPYKTSKIRHGLPVNVGSTEETCIHLDHGYAHHNDYFAYGYITYNYVSHPFAEIDYTNEIPVWAKTEEAEVVRRCVKNLQNEHLDFGNNIQLIEDFYLIEFHKVLKPSNKHLVVVSIFKPDFKHKDPAIVLKHKQQITSMLCGRNFTYVCFSNIPVDGIDCIPHSLKQDEEMTPENIKKTIYRKDVKYPKGSHVVYAGINDKLIPAMFHTNKAQT